MTVLPPLGTILSFGGEDWRSTRYVITAYEGDEMSQRVEMISPRNNGQGYREGQGRWCDAYLQRRRLVPVTPTTVIQLKPRE